MIDINLIRNNPELVKENIKKKNKEDKLRLVDEFLETDEQFRQLKLKADNLRKAKNDLSSKIGELMRDGRIDEVEDIKKKADSIAIEIENIEVNEKDLEIKRTIIWKQIPNIIDSDVPIGKGENDNVEIRKHGVIKNIDFEIPYHVDLLEKLSGIDLESARAVSGNGFYYLTGDIARLHSAILTYARDFMINKGFTYVVPPFVIKRHAVEGVMSFEEMDNMMYKIEGEDLYLIGTSEHTMISRYVNKNLKAEQLPLTLTSYSPCFRKEKGAHGIEERGIYRIHQFEKQEMIVICNPEDSRTWFEKMIDYTVEFFLSLDIPVRELECCSGDLADLKVKSIDVEAWSPRQQKYFEVGSCSNLGDAQSRRLNIKMSDGNYPHTLNNTVVAPPRMLIAFLENNINEDGSITIPEVLRPYMGGKDKIN